jgi:hypothetical protein
MYDSEAKTIKLVNLTLNLHKHLMSAKQKGERMRQAVMAPAPLEGVKRSVD